MVEVGKALQRISQGDAGAREHVLDATLDDAWLLALCMVQDEKLAELAVAHAYQDIWQHAGEGANCSISPRAWVMTMVSSSAASMKAHTSRPVPTVGARTIDALLVAHRWCAQVIGSLGG